MFLTAIIFRKAFQDGATPSMMVLLGTVCVISTVIVILSAIFSSDK